MGQVGDIVVLVRVRSDDRLLSVYRVSGDIGVGRRSDRGLHLEGWTGCRLVSRLYSGHDGLIGYVNTQFGYHHQKLEI